MNSIKKFIEVIKINNSDITKQEGNFSLLGLGSIVPGMFRPYINKYYDFDFGALVFIMHERYGGVFFSDKFYANTTQESLKRFLEGNFANFKELKDFEKIQNLANKYFENNTIKILRELDENKLLDVIKMGYSLAHMWVAATIFSEPLDKAMIEKNFRDLGIHNISFEEFFNMASLVNFESFALRFNTALLKYNKEKIKNKEEKIQWLFFDYYVAPDTAKIPLLVNQMIKDKGGENSIKEEINHIRKDIEENKEKVQRYKASLDKPAVQLFNFIQTAMYIRDVRKVSIQKVFTIISNALRQLFIFYGLELNDIVYAHSFDFTTDIYKKEYMEEIERRKREGVVLYVDNSGGNFSYGDIEKSREELYSVIGDTTHLSVGNNDEIHGNIACKGYAYSSVKIVLNEKDFSKFKDGDILVTSMTRPEFVPLMKKASAIITDEGGITCHAAIISRELNIPCVIGTKNATRVLKDNDEVEVDADNGIVRIIKKAG